MSPKKSRKPTRKLVNNSRLYKVKGGVRKRGREEETSNQPSEEKEKSNQPQKRPIPKKVKVDKPKEQPDILPQNPVPNEDSTLMNGVYETNYSTSKDGKSKELHCTVIENRVNHNKYAHATLINDDKRYHYGTKINRTGQVEQPDPTFWGNKATAIETDTFDYEYSKDRNQKNIPVINILQKHYLRCKYPKLSTQYYNKQTQKNENVSDILFNIDYPDN